MPHAVPMPPARRTIHKPAHAPAAPAHDARLPAAWTRAARDHADAILLAPQYPSPTHHHRAAHSLSSVSSITSSAPAWPPIDARRLSGSAPGRVPAPAQRTMGAAPPWPPASAAHARGTTIPFDRPPPSSASSPSPVISLCSTNFSDLCTNAAAQDSERFTEVSPSSSMWASDDLEDAVSDIVFNESPLDATAQDWTMQPALYQSFEPRGAMINVAPSPLEPGPVYTQPYCEPETLPPVQEYTTFVVEAPLAPQMPVVTPEYTKTAKHLSEWAAEWLCRITSSTSLEDALNGPQWSHGRRPVVPAYLAENIRASLMSTLLQPSVIFLALWYIARLPVYRGGPEPRTTSGQNFRRVLFGEGQFMPGSEDKHALEYYAPFKLFVNGVLLASKMLDDATFTNRVWHEITHIAIKDINSLELSSLDHMRYDLTVPTDAWTQWLLVLRDGHVKRAPYPAPIGPVKDTPHGVILQTFNLLIDASVARMNPSDGPTFLGIEERIAKRMRDLEESVDLDDMDEDGPLRDEYRRSRRSSSIDSQGPVMRDSPRDLPPPAEWFPAADPIVSRAEPTRRAPWTPATMSRNVPYGMQPPHLAPAYDLPRAYVAPLYPVNADYPGYPPVQPFAAPPGLQYGPRPVVGYI
ncbi:hypothetical protein AURDEDRAFT_110490 [Auricularia subglabra TFB-10046 SS5]|nr:hypothetical protein AURDEDRAFT_110490 [Auricularia subglabra TFB-10046 SS5]